MQPALTAPSPQNSLLLSQGYGYIPRAVMTDRSISAKAKALYAYLCCFAGKGSAAWPSVERIGNDMGLGVTAFRSALKQLSGSGYVSVERVKEKGRFVRSVYTLADSPPVKNQPVVDQPMKWLPVETQPVSAQPVNGPPAAGCTHNNNTLNNTTNDDEEDSFSQTRTHARGPQREKDVGKTTCDLLDFQPFPSPILPLHLPSLIKSCKIPLISNIGESMIKISDLRVPLNAGPGELRRAAASTLGIPAEDVLSLDVLRQAVDARHKGSIKFAYAVAAEVRDEAAALRSAPSGRAEKYEAPVYGLPKPGDEKLSTRPVVVGAGPAGMLAAWVLAKAGYRPVVLERGRDTETRWSDAEAFQAGGPLDEDSNVQFGEGGAGAFSDGKLVTRVRDERCPAVLRLLVECGAPPDILYSARAHVGTDELRKVIPAVRREIEAMGGEYRFSQAVEGLILKGNKLAGLHIRGGGTVDAEAAVLAIGHSARDTVERLFSGGVAFEAKPFAVGFRAEHPQALIDRAAWGAHTGDPRLGAADYHLSAKVGDRAVYTFCMCPGGSVVNASSEQGRLAVNGMSLRARAGANANAAVVAAVSAEEAGEGPLAGIAFQRMLEEKAFSLCGGWRAPAQRVGDYLAGRASKAFGAVKPTVRPEAVPADLGGILPKAVDDAVRAALWLFDRQLPGYAMADAVLTAVESRTSSPVRMPRGSDMQAEGIEGLYPAGEGAGWAGGIVSAAVDGMRAAEALIARWRI